MELTTAIDWFGTLSGVFGIVLAIYLQLINPRRVDPFHVTALFAGGSALVMVFSAAWIPNEHAVQSLKIGAILLFTTLEGVGAYYVWKHAEAAPPHEVVMSLFNDDGGSHG